VLCTNTSPINETPNVLTCPFVECQVHGGSGPSNSFTVAGYLSDVTVFVGDPPAVSPTSMMVNVTSPSDPAGSYTVMVQYTSANGGADVLYGGSFTWPGVAPPVPGPGPGAC